MANYKKPDGRTGLIYYGVVQKVVPLARRLDGEAKAETDELLVCILDTASAVKVHAPHGEFASGDRLGIDIWKI